MNGRRFKSKFRHPFPRYKVFEPDMVKEIRDYFGESCAVFSKRFFLSEKRIKCWQSKGSTHAYPLGPAVVILIELEKIMVEEREEHESIRKGWGGRSLTDFEELESLGQKRLFN